MDLGAVSAEQRAPDPIHAQRIGAVLGGRYRLNRLLGAGGMGAVYEAVDPAGNRYAIKVLLGMLGGDPELLRFAREARIMSTLANPHITRVVDMGTDSTNGAPYLVMELMAGEDLESVLRRCGPLAPAVAVRILLQACAGIEAAHAAGIIHRDVKPANVFLDSSSGRDINVKVCDFGIAKPLFAGETMTESGDSFGSPCYMAPEQAKDAKRVDGRADVWSLGMTLYELLTGGTAFDKARSVPDMMIQLTTQDAPSVQERAPWASEALSVVTHGALIRDVDARCPNVGALIDALRPLTEGSEQLDVSMLVPLSPELRSRSAPRARLPRSWHDVEASVPSTRAPPDPASVAVRLLGQTLGRRYKLLRVLGAGGMGAVYETRGPAGERYAAKVILGDAGSQRADAVARFVREARAVMSIRSAHVVNVVDADTDATQQLPFIVMEQLDGQDLAELIRSAGPLEAGAAARIFVEACRGLADAHRLGIVHRDVKPANIFLHELPSGELITKVCDFGVAKQVLLGDGDATAVDLTRTGGLLGSPMYFSPEQARNAKDVDSRTDVWSLAVSLYEALSGRRPAHECSTVGELILAICTEDARPLQEVAPWIPGELAAVVHKALRRDPSQRYASMDAFRDALEPFAAKGRLSRRELVAVSPESRARTAPQLLVLGSSKTAYATTLHDHRGRGMRARASFKALVGAGLLVALTVAGTSAVVMRGRFERLHAVAPPHVAEALPRTSAVPLAESASALPPPSALASSTPVMAPALAPSATAPASGHASMAAAPARRLVRLSPSAPPPPTAAHTAVPPPNNGFATERGGGN